MRACVLITLFTVLPAMAFAQQPAAQTAAAAARLFASSADVTAMMARAQKERKPEQANFIQPIVQSASYTANLEYRVGGVAAPATVHERDAEMFYVVDGTGTIVTGGTLRDGKRTNAENLAGTAIDNGMTRRIAKGDWVMVPANTPHWFSQVDGTLVLMSIHLPIAAPSAASPR
jgi:mannose-6-phosphate isomerase-like protein (cupin superfamily)